MVEDYLKLIKKLNLLSAEEEEELWRQFKENDQSTARLKLIESYQPLVFKLVNQSTGNQGLLMDLIQEGNIGLIEAVDSFDHQRGIRFSSFAVYHIKGRIKDYWQKGKKHYHLQLEQHLIPAGELTEQVVESILLLERIYRLIPQLPVKEQRVINGLYLDNKVPALLAQEMEISCSYLYRLQKRAVKRLRGKLSGFLKHWKEE